jgi:hypothetical protein
MSLYRFVPHIPSYLTQLWGTRMDLTCLEVGCPVEERVKPSVGSKRCMLNVSAFPELMLV